jgi:L-seryl-tRNA(Ser) seleniumtransferase
MTPKNPSDLFAHYGLKQVINVAGTMTYIGASMVVPRAIEASETILNHFVHIDALQAAAGSVISRVTGAEAGFVTACSAAGIVLGIAGCMTGADLAKIEKLPETDGLKHEVAVLSGHLINYGAPIDQAIRQSGARITPVGTAALSHSYHLEDAIGDNTAAALYVVSHHVVQEGQIPMAEFISICKERNVPVIVDMASEYDLITPIKLGADLVLYSSHKFLGGPTAGIVAGKKRYVRNAYLQNRGIGRPMKIGKEGIIGTMAALEAWEDRDHGAVRKLELARVDFFMEKLGNIDGLALTIHSDWTNNPINRVKVKVDLDRAGLYAWELAQRLAAGQPSIQVRDDLIEWGYFFLDPCNLKQGEEKIVSDRIAEEVRSALTARDGRVFDISEYRRRKNQRVLKWPEI